MGGKKRKKLSYVVRMPDPDKSETKKPAEASETQSIDDMVECIEKPAEASETYALTQSIYDDFEKPAEASETYALTQSIYDDMVECFENVVQSREHDNQIIGNRILKKLIILKKNSDGISEEYLVAVRQICYTILPAFVRLRPSISNILVFGLKASYERVVSDDYVVYYVGGMINDDAGCGGDGGDSDGGGDGGDCGGDGGGDCGD